MLEVTVTYKAEITDSYVRTVDSDDGIFITKDIIANDIKESIGADDVHVSHLKYFVREIDDDGED